MSILDKSITKLGVGFSLATASIATPSLIAISREKEIINLNAKNKQLKIEQTKLIQEKDAASKPKPKQDKQEIPDNIKQLLDKIENLEKETSEQKEKIDYLLELQNKNWNLENKKHEMDQQETKITELKNKLKQAYKVCDDAKHKQNKQCHQIKQVALDLEVIQE